MVCARWPRGCNLLIDCIDLAEPQLQARLIALATEGHPAFSGRILLTAESSLKDLEGVPTQIRVPPLRVRRSDLGDWLRYSLHQRSPSLGWSRPDQPLASAHLKTKSIRLDESLLKNIDL